MVGELSRKIQNMIIILPEILLSVAILSLVLYGLNVPAVSQPQDYRHSRYCYNIQKLIPAGSLTKTQQDSRKHQFSVLNWLRNVIKCALNYISEPIKHTKTSVFCYAVKFQSGIGLDHFLCVMTKLPASFH